MQRRITRSTPTCLGRHDVSSHAIGVMVLQAGAAHALRDLGLTERVNAVGGELVAGPRPSRGFAVRARLPIDPSVETRAGSAW